MNTKQHFGIYTLVLMGVMFIAATGCKKEEETGVPVLTTSEVTKYAQITAESGGAITSDGGLEVTARGICWSTSANPTIADHKTSDKTGENSFTGKLTGLVAGTTYYVRAYATNSKGTGYGNTIVFQTLGNTFTDPRDGNEYTIATIGNQLWMTENLKYLPDVMGPVPESSTDPLHYVYGYAGTDLAEAKATANYATYGTLFNWTAANDACPPGWHLPSRDEWAELVDLHGGSWNAGAKLKEAGTTHWEFPNSGATNESGFTALPGGKRDSFSASFIGKGTAGIWWSATEMIPEGPAWMITLETYGSDVFGNFGDKVSGFSVRCLRD